MYRVKRITFAAIIAAALTLALPVHAQPNYPVSGFCAIGGQRVVTSGLQSTSYVQASYPGCQVSVVLTGTATPATIYSDAGGTALANPFTATALGAWIFYASPAAAYDITISGTGLAHPFTFTGLGAGGGGLGLLALNNIWTGLNTFTQPLTVGGTPPTFTVAIAAPSVLTANYTQTLQAQTGTVADLSDITAANIAQLGTVNNWTALQNFNAGLNATTVTATTVNATTVTATTVNATTVTAQTFTTIPIASGLVIAGDSRCAAAGGQEWANQMQSLSQFAGRFISYHNTCVAGRTIGQMVTAYASEVALFKPATTGISPTYLFVDIGTNNLSDGGAGPAVAYNLLTPYWAQAKADGFTVVAMTQILAGSTSSGGFFTSDWIQEFNDFVRRGTPGTYDILVDMATLFPNPYNQVFFQSDYVHPNVPAGNLLEARYVNWAFGGGFPSVETFDGRIGLVNFRCDITSFPPVGFGGSLDTACGVMAGANLNSGVNNTLLGAYAGTALTVGNSNTLVGATAGWNMISAGNNVGEGVGSLGGDVDGSNNVAIGLDSGRYQADGVTQLNPNGSVYLGAGTRGKDNSSSNEIVVGLNAIGQGSNTVQLGNSSVTSGKVGAQAICLANGVGCPAITGYTGTVTCTAGQHINSITVVNGIITVAPTCN
jgi:hypothetical protein